MPQNSKWSGEDNIHLCVVMTADRGLCGGFNSNIIKKAKSYFKKLSDNGKTKIITVGSKGYDQQGIYKDNMVKEFHSKI